MAKATPRSSRQIRDWIYNHPPLEVGGIIILLSVLASWIGLYGFDRLVHISVRSGHNDVAGFIIAIVGVIHAVLLAFIAVAAWDAHDAAGGVVRQEANLVGNLYRDSVALDEPLRSRIRGDLRDYIDLVVHREWPSQQRGAVDPVAWGTVEALHTAIVSIDARNLSQAVVEAEILRTLNELYSARRSRLLAAQDGIPDTVWWIIVLGGATTIAFSFFFGMPSMPMHYAMTGILAVSMALVMVLIVELDWPLRGSVSISAGAFTAVGNDIDHMGAGH